MVEEKSLISEKKIEKKNLKIGGEKKVLGYSRK